MLHTRALLLLPLLAPASLAFQCPGNDGLEPNDSCAQAAAILPAFYPGLAGLDAEEDWFQLLVPAGQRVEARVFYSQFQGNLHMRLIAECVDVAPVLSASGGDLEQVAWTNCGASPALATWAVQRVGSPPGCNSYDMVVTLGPDSTPSVGTSYCQSTPGALGLPAVMKAFGSASVAGNDLRLAAGPVQPGVNGIFYYGTTAVSNPLGQGFACAGGSVFRLPVIQADGAGGLTYELDLMDLPSGGAIAAGSTWYFSAWFRDPGTNPPFQLADGREILFLP